MNAVLEHFINYSLIRCSPKLMELNMDKTLHIKWQHVSITSTEAYPVPEMEEL